MINCQECNEYAQKILDRGEIEPSELETLVLNRHVLKGCEAEKIRKNHCYLGDGVYIEFDGYGFWLRTGNHQDHLCDNRIYLEPDIIESMNKFINQVRKD